MASQTQSGFATEGTQYGIDSSYFLLDTVPGNGAVLQGPITVAGNLTTTGTTTSQGNLAAPSVATSSVISSGALNLTSSGGSNVNVQAGTGGVAISGNSLLAQVPGQVLVSSGTNAANLVMGSGGQVGLSTLGPSTFVQVQAQTSGAPGAASSSLLLPASGNVALSGSGTLSVVASNITTVTTPEMNLNSHVIIRPKAGMGVPGTPVAINVNAATVYFEMTGNKLFARITGSTLGAAYIRLPLGVGASEQPPFVFVTDAAGVLRGNAFSAGGLFYSGTPAPGSGLTPNSWYWQQNYLGADFIVNILVL